MPSNTVQNLPSYTITSEEYIQDYLTLPDDQKLVLFKLRMGYAMKGSSLTSDDIEGLSPAFTEEQKTNRRKVLRRFFRKSDDCWIDDRVEDLIEAKKQKDLHRAHVSAERSRVGRMGALKRFPQNSQEVKSGDIAENLDKTNSQQKRSNCFNKTIANAEQLVMQNDGNCFSKTVTNAKQLVKQNDGNCSSKNIANTGQLVKQSDSNCFGKKVANVDDLLEQNQKFSTNLLKNKQIENSANHSEMTSSEPSLAHTPTRTRASDPINNIYLLNKNKIIRSDARTGEHTRVHAHTHEGSQEKIKEIFETNSSLESWPSDQLMLLFTSSGLNHSALEAWISRTPFNHDKFNQLLSSIKTMGYVDYLNVISRCRLVKEKEGREFKTSVAFVIKALEKQIDLIRANAKPPDQSAKPERFSDKVYRKEGLILMPNGSYRVLPRSQR